MNQITLNLPKKGFEMPVGFWLVGRFKKELDHLVDIPWLDTEMVKGELAMFYRDPRNYMKIWSLLVLSKWMERYDVQA